MVERQTKWKAVPNGNDFIKGYIKCDCKVAFVRILTKYLSPMTFNQYFQISYTLEDGTKGFQSFKIYDDYEESMIRDAIDGIPEYTMTK